MDDNVVQMPPPEKPPEFLAGPFQTWKVVVHGRFIPRLTGRQDSDGRFWLVVDGRFGQPFSSRDDAHGAAVLIGQAMAVVSGYSNLEADTKDMPFAHRAVGITGPDDEPRP